MEDLVVQLEKEEEAFLGPNDSKSKFFLSCKMQTTSYLSYVNSCQWILTDRSLGTFIHLFDSIPTSKINALSSSSVSDLFQLEAVNLSAAFSENRSKG